VIESNSDANGKRVKVITKNWQIDKGHEVKNKEIVKNNELRQDKDMVKELAEVRFQHGLLEHLLL
jgi:hypothetical protein